MNRNRPLSPEEHAEAVAIARELAGAVRDSEYEPLVERARKLFGTDADDEDADLFEMMELLEAPEENREAARIVMRRLLERRGRHV